MEHKINNIEEKNPNCLEAEQLAVYVELNVNNYCIYW